MPEIGLEPITKTSSRFHSTDWVTRAIKLESAGFEPETIPCKSIVLPAKLWPLFYISEEGLEPSQL